MTSSRLASLATWTSAVFAAIQGLRLVTNVILSRILAPELFGIMLIVNSVRTGVDLFTDVGIGQNIVSSPNADEPRFYNTAWTIQVARGLLVAAICCAVAIPLSRLYDVPILASILPLASIWFILGGVESTGRFAVQRKMLIGRISVFEITVAVLTAVIHIALAYVWPTVWALVVAGLISNVFVAIGTYYLDPTIKHRFHLSREYVWQIIHFGKWLFLSSIVFFLATNLDRLYLGNSVPLAVLGVYGVARSLADVLSQLAGRIGNTIVFPLVASSQVATGEIKSRFGGIRLKALAVAGLLTAVFAVASGPFVRIVYDERYAAAAAMLPLMAVGLWFWTMSTIGESILLGLRRPAYGAGANVVKLAALAIGLPLGVEAGGIMGAIVALVAAEGARYLALLAAQVREGMSFIVQDVIMTAATLATGLLLYELLRLIPWTASLLT